MSRNNGTVDVVHIVDERILLIQRDSNGFPKEFRGMWALPGGHVDDGESWHDAAAREFMEETGLEVKCMTDLEYIGGFEVPNRPETQVFVYQSKIGCEPNAGDDAQDAAWFLIEDVLNHAFPLAFNHKDILKEIFDA